MEFNLEMDVYDETEKLTKEQINIIKEILGHSFETENIENHCEVSVTIVNNEKIQLLNKEYRGKDRATDVISFALNEKGEDELEIIGDEETPVVLGDIVISVDKVIEQAEEYGHSFERELAFLTVHGFLHLVGYDHNTKKEENAMFLRQEEILKAYGLER